VALIGLGFSSRGSRRKKLLGFSFIWIVSAGLIILPACGGGSNSGGGGGCSTVPSVPTGLASSSTTSSGTTLNWTASTAGSGCSVTGYTVYQNGNPLPTPITNTTYNVTGLTAGTQYSFSVAAGDSAGASAQSSAINVTTLSNATPSGTYTITITGKDANSVTQTGSAPTVTAVVN
jgi:chitinase